LTLQGTKQDSNVSTLGGTAVAGRGEYFGPHFLITLPNGKDFYHSLSVGIDYKHFDQNILVAGVETVTPISYYPISATYFATWIDKDQNTKKGNVTELNGGVNLHLRGMGSGSQQFDDSRYDAEGNYIYFRGDLSHTRDLPSGFQFFGKVQGQLSDQPLINSEQFSAGGLGTVRGYLESTALADDAIGGTLELRTPSLSDWMGTRVNEWRFYAFTDAAILQLRNPLPEQTSRFNLASYGVGSRVQFHDHFSGSFDLGIPLIGQGSVSPHDLLLIFRLWADF
jgi:hemolysin activation/secretion protein